MINIFFKVALLLFFLLISSLLSFENLKQEYELSYNHSNIDIEGLALDARLETFDYYKNFYGNIRFRLIADKKGYLAKIDRAFIEFNHNKFLSTVGRQRIYWGSSNIFNFTDIFNEIDIYDPYKDRLGVDAVRILYNHSYFSRIEAVNEFNSDNKFALRYTFVYNNFEYMINYLNYQNICKNEDYIFEFKGDIILGVWGQIVRKQQPESMNIFVFGTDYSFLINNKTLYLISEISLNTKLNQTLYYLGSIWSFDEFINFVLNYTGSKSDKLIFQTGIDYVIDDYKKLSVYYDKVYNIAPLFSHGLNKGDKISLIFNISI